MSIPKVCESENGVCVVRQSQFVANTMSLSAPRTRENALESVGPLVCFQSRVGVTNIEPIYHSALAPVSLISSFESSSHCLSSSSSSTT